MENLQYQRSLVILLFIISATTNLLPLVESGLLNPDFIVNAAKAIGSDVDSAAGSISSNYVDDGLKVAQAAAKRDSPEAREIQNMRTANKAVKELCDRYAQLNCPILSGENAMEYNNFVQTVCLCSHKSCFCQYNSPPSQVSNMPTPDSQRSHASCLSGVTWVHQILCFAISQLVLRGIGVFYL